MTSMHTGPTRWWREDVLIAHEGDEECRGNDHAADYLDRPAADRWNDRTGGGGVCAASGDSESAVPLLLGSARNQSGGATVHPRDGVENEEEESAKKGGARLYWTLNKVVIAILASLSLSSHSRQKTSQNLASSFRNASGMVKGATTAGDMSNLMNSFYPSTRRPSTDPREAPPSFRVGQRV